MKVITLTGILVFAFVSACSSDDAVDFPDTMDSTDMPVDNGQDDAAVPDTEPDYETDIPVEVPEVVDFTDDEDCFQDIDIVFVIDVSTSMTWVLAKLRDEVGAVWDYAMTLSDHSDYDPMFGLVVFVDDVLVTNSGNPYTSAGDLQAEFENWRAFCSTEAQPGGSSCRNMDCPENTLDALAAAAEQFPWRESAMHIAIHVTDDTFKENPDMLCSQFAPSILVQHTYSQTISLLVANEVRVGTFAVRNSSVCPIPANKAPGFFDPWNGQDAIPVATGSRVWDLHDVQTGAISLTEAIQGFVLEEWCTEFLI